MQRHREDLRDFVSVPLRDAILCVDCECVTSSRSDNCPVCGSHSVFPIAPVLGGTRVLTGELPIGRRRSSVRFDLEIRVDLKDIDARDVNAIVEAIAATIPSSRADDAVSFHMDVDPVMPAQPHVERRAA